MNISNITSSDDSTLWKPIFSLVSLLKLKMTSENLSVSTGQWNDSLVCERNSFTMRKKIQAVFFPP